MNLAIREIKTRGYLQTIELAVTHYERIMRDNPYDPWAIYQLTTLRVLVVDLRQELLELQHTQQTYQTKKDPG